MDMRNEDSFSFLPMTQSNRSMIESMIRGAFLSLTGDEAYKAWEKGLPKLHSQTTAIFTSFEEFVVCLDWVYLSKFLSFICLSCIFPMF